MTMIAVVTVAVVVAREMKGMAAVALIAMKVDAATTTTLEEVAVVAAAAAAAAVANVAAIIEAAKIETTEPPPATKLLVVAVAAAANTLAVAITHAKTAMPAGKESSVCPGVDTLSYVRA